MASNNAQRSNPTLVFSLLHCYQTRHTCSYSASVLPDKALTLTPYSLSPPPRQGQGGTMTSRKGLSRGRRAAWSQRAVIYPTDASRKAKKRPKPAINCTNYLLLTDPPLRRDVRTQHKGKEVAAPQSPSLSFPPSLQHPLLTPLSFLFHLLPHDDASCYILTCHLVLFFLIP